MFGTILAARAVPFRSFAPDIADVFSVKVQQASGCASAIRTPIKKRNFVSFIPTEAICFCLEFLTIDQKYLVIRLFFDSVGRNRTAGTFDRTPAFEHGAMWRVARSRNSSLSLDRLLTARRGRWVNNCDTTAGDSPTHE